MRQSHEPRIRAEKVAVVGEMKARLSGAKAAVLLDYRGLNVAQDTKMRRRLREAGVEYRVIKNTLTAIAARELNLDGLEPFLAGPTAIALSTSDPVAPARLVSDFVKEFKVIEIKAGLVEGKVIDALGVKALASLPSREELLAQMLGSMQAPLTGLVNVLQGNMRGLVRALEAIREKKAVNS
ncbi:MAG: 50S ribosomal protein L10 [Negativicutes bacterium]|nr:50S ribosomal protein L10 [Negativicutes bacterium]